MASHDQVTSSEKGFTRITFFCTSHVQCTTPTNHNCFLSEFLEMSLLFCEKLSQKRSDSLLLCLMHQLEVATRPQGEFLFQFYFLVMYAAASLAFIIFFFLCGGSSQIFHHVQFIMKFQD